MRVRPFPHLLFLVLLALLAAVGPGAAQTLPRVQNRYFVTSDGVRLHYLDAGPRGAHILLFVPGWTMPAWIWAPQIAAFSHRYHVVAFDPRGQGDSDVPATGYTPGRRGQDIAELIARLEPVPVLVVGWSLGVLDTLAYVHADGDALIAGLVLVDNSVGEEPAPIPRPPRPHRGPPPPHAVAMRRFVQGMFRRPQNAAWLDRLTEATLHTPEAASRALLSYPVPRSYWRAAIYSTVKPVLYIVRPGFAAQAANLRRNRPNTETALFAHAGHALFIDDAPRFNALLASFIHRRIWP
ncbi:MAG TPA: alpha/beta hydrolase [Acetobacteraceae bacterium]|nr:alpha/beta hydrolase [Acetobacteraceae bacterium]